MYVFPVFSSIHLSIDLFINLVFTRLKMCCELGGRNERRACVDDDYYRAWCAWNDSIVQGVGVSRRIQMMVRMRYVTSYEG